MEQELQFYWMVSQRQRDLRIYTTLDDQDEAIELADEMKTLARMSEWPALRRAAAASTQVGPVGRSYMLPRIVRELMAGLARP